VDRALTPIAVTWPLGSLLWLTIGFYAAVEITRHAREIATSGLDLADDAGTVGIATACAYAAPMFGFAVALQTQASIPGAGAPWLRLAGLVLLWCGIAFRWWSVWTLGRFFRSAVVIDPAHRVVSEGPYRVIRHPAYAGTILASAGIGLALGNWLSLAVCVLLPLTGYLWRMRVEDRVLKAKLPGYAGYAERTPRLIPFVW
jgi:protein-S-isoprenylcysteine O-methyltransferase